MEACMRIAASCLLAAGLLFVGLYLFANRTNGTFGFTSTLLMGRAAVRVDSVDRAGAAQRAGIHAGDVFAPASGSWHDRAPLYLFANAPIVAAGDVGRIVLERGDSRRVVSLRAAANASSPAIEALFFALLAVPMLALGWFISWRKPGDRDAVLLGGMLQLFGVALAIPDRVGSPLARLVLYELTASTFFILGVYCALVFFAGYSRGAGFKRLLRRVCLYAGTAVTALEILLMSATYMLPAFVGDVSGLTGPSVACVVLVPVLAFVCLVDAFRAGTIIDRQRLRWIGGSFFLGFSGPMLLPGATLLMGSSYTVIDQVLFSATFYVLAAGLTYAVLKRRVVDVAFVLNRALVFSVVSGIVVACFIALEWLAGALLVNLSRPTSFIIEGGIAIVIGFSLRPIHDRTDHFIDRVFFAKRHAAEKALRHLATEVNFIRDRESLLARVQRDLTAYLETTAVCIYYRSDVQSDFALLCSTSDAAEFVDADDDAAVGMAVEEVPIELHTRVTNIAGELAVPMAVRKALMGILVVGHKRSGEAFAPDEIESLRFLAGYLATALASTSASDGASQTTDALLRELIAETRQQREEITMLHRRLDATAARLPEANL
ncbi:MAG: hypothetical protein ABR508_11735 [Candidatus Baltobacteraceae bacterium]